MTDMEGVYVGIALMLIPTGLLAWSFLRYLNKIAIVGAAVTLLGVILIITNAKPEEPIQD